MNDPAGTPPTPVYEGYFADPFVLRWGEGYYAYGTGPGGSAGGRVFEVLSSPDLRHWVAHGGALSPLDDQARDYWAPEVTVAGDRLFMYYSVGTGDQGHHLRVAAASHPLGPFTDLGVNLTPGESFAIDGHPFQDADGQRYLFLARDRLDGNRPGTSLAVLPLLDPQTPGGPLRDVLRASGDWQIYQRERAMYGQTFDWHTLEGPFVLRRGGRYHCLYSGGAWINDTYGVGHAVADHPLGPWHEPEAGPVVLKTSPGLIGPGHCSVVTDGAGQDVLVFHAWNAGRTKRQLYLLPLDWRSGAPRVQLG